MILLSGQTQALMGTASRTVDSRERGDERRPGARYQSSPVPPQSSPAALRNFSGTLDSLPNPDSPAVVLDSCGGLRSALYFKLLAASHPSKSEIGRMLRDRPLESPTPANFDLCAVASEERSALPDPGPSSPRE